MALDTMQLAWETTTHYPNHGRPAYTGTLAQRKLLQNTAIDRNTPFHQSKNDKVRHLIKTEKLNMFQLCKESR